jgi:hypothetical protein
MRITLLLTLLILQPIENSLNGGSNVTGQTTSSGTGGAGDIIVAAPLSWTSNKTLTLDAYHGVTVNANSAITASGSSAGLTITTNDGGSGGYFTVNSPSTLPGTASLHINSTAYTLLTTNAGLQNISSVGNFALANDLTLSGSWNPLYFGGNFQGLGHTISNLSFSTSSYSAGLFSSIVTGASVANLTIANANVASSAGDLGILAGQNSGNIYHTFTSGVVTGTSTGYGFGGLVGGSYAGAKPQ